MIAALVFYVSSTPFQSVRFVDSVELVVAAMTAAGFNTVNLSTLNTWQQIILFLLMIMGSPIFVSSAILYIRKRTYEKRIEEFTERKRNRLGPLRNLTTSVSKRKAASNPHEEAIASGAVRGRAIRDEEDARSTYGPTQTASESADDILKTDGSNDQQAHPGGPHMTFGPANDRSRQTTSSQPQLRSRRNSFFSNTGVAARDFELHPRNAQPLSQGGLQAPSSGDKLRPGSLAKVYKYLNAIEGNGGRISRTHHLNEQERRILVGMEYEAIRMLSYLVPVYFILLQLFGAIGLGAWMQINRPDVALRNGVDPFWTGAFFAVSAFTTSGMSLLDANAAALQTSSYCLISLSLLMLAGNTCFPPFLRLFVWIGKLSLLQRTPWTLKQKTTLSFILDHPRRVYTNLFPAKHTWWLVFSLVLLNGIGWAAFVIANLCDPIITSTSTRFQVLGGLFQAISLRSAGFYVVVISGLPPGLLWICGESLPKRGLGDQGPGALQVLEMSRCMIPESLGTVVSRA